MNRRLKRNVALGAIGALAVAGGGAAYAASGTTNPQDALLNDAAQRLNVTPDKLRSALKAAFGDQLDQAVKDGKLTQKQADAIKQHAPDGGLPPLGGPPGAHFEFRGGGPGPHFGMMVGPGGGAAATYLGLTAEQLRTRLTKGDSLADVAKAQGKSVDGLKQALLDAAKSDLDKAVAAGDLAAKQRDEMLKQLGEHVGDMIQGKGPGPGGPGGPGFGPPPGARHFEFHTDRGGGSSNAPGSFESGTTTSSSGA